MLLFDVAFTKACSVYPTCFINLFSDEPRLSFYSNEHRKLLINYRTSLALVEQKKDIEKCYYLVTQCQNIILKLLKVAPFTKTAGTF